MGKWILGNWKFGKGLLLVTTVCVVEILTTEGINFSAKSANEAGTFFEWELREKFSVKNKVINNILIFFI